ncbi:hypothetical protein ACOMHN_066389 [Nucella lapillus]
MAGFDFAFLFVVCCFVSSSVYRCSAWKRRIFAENLQLRNKRVAGERVVTYNDVTAVTCAIRCTSQYPCGAYAYNSEEQTCTFCTVCGNFTLMDGAGFRFYVTIDEGHSDSSDDEVGICPDVMADPEKCWKPCPSPATLVHVSVGPAGVWAVNSQDSIYYRRGTYQNLRSLGTAWTGLTYGKMVQLDIGTDVLWGVNTDQKLFPRRGISASSQSGLTWADPDFGKRWVSVSPGGSLWARNITDRLLYHNGSWQAMDMDVSRLDAGLAGLWVLNTSGHLFHRLGTFGDTGSAGTEWRPLEGGFRSVGSGREVVVGVDTGGRVWVRTGLGPDTPTGLSWLRYPGNMTQVDVYQSDDGVVLWGLNWDGQVFFSLLSG